jgi:uncharacterized protein (UPF0548 family)
VVTAFNFAGEPTLDGRAPDGYRLTERSRVIAPGGAPDRFEAVRDAILAWKVQTGSGFIPLRVPERVAIGAVSAFRIPFGPLRPTVTCRVFAVIDEADRAGFAHGAIRGHPQSGWESYIVDRAPDGTLTMRIRVVARASAWWMRLAGPGAHLALDILLRRNLRSLDGMLAR